MIHQSHPKAYNSGSIHLWWIEPQMYGTPENYCRMMEEKSAEGI